MVPQPNRTFNANVQAWSVPAAISFKFVDSDLVRIVSSLRTCQLNMNLDLSNYNTKRSKISREYKAIGLLGGYLGTVSLEG